MHASGSPLDNIKVASPCTAEWRFMLGNDLVRFCGQCNKNVYNLSRMKRADAETLIRRMEGQLCVRYYMRSDGTILNSDCPVGLRAAHQRVRRIATAAFAVLVSFFANIGLLSLLGKGESAISPVMGGIAVPYVGSGEPVYPPVVGKPAAPQPPVIGRVVFSTKTVYRSEGFLLNNVIRRVEEDSTFSRAGSRGRDVVVRLTVSQTGEVVNVKYISGPPALESIAAGIARQWKFRPVMVNNQAVQVEGPLTLRIADPNL